MGKVIVAEHARKSQVERKPPYRPDVPPITPEEWETLAELAVSAEQTLRYLTETVRQLMAVVRRLDNRGLPKQAVRK